VRIADALPKIDHRRSDTDLARGHEFARLRGDINSYACTSQYSRLDGSAKHPDGSTEFAQV
jgi:hypothetical protein